MNYITNEKKQLTNHVTAKERVKERFMSLSKSLVVFISILSLISYYSFFENTTVIAKTKEKKYVTVTGKAVGIGSKETVKKDKKKEKEQEKKNTTLATKPKKDGKNYIVKLSNSSQTKYMEKHLDDSKEINANSENKLENECMVNTTLTKKELIQLKNDTNIEYIEEDFIAKACANGNNSNKNNNSNSKANNSIKGKMFHKKKEKRIKKNNSKHEWNIQMINADKVKENASKENADNKVKLAILDSGVDAGNDIDLAYQVSLVPGEEEMTQVFMDGNGHGSSVASLIGAKDNGEGITGINPNAKIYSYRVLDDENKAPVSRIVEAIYMAISQNVNIINMSFGLNEHSKALEEAIKDANKAGILVIAAAGNTGEKVQYPAAFDEVMAVGAVDKLGNVEDYSAKGDKLEVVAPGELIKTTGFLDSYEVTSGTSLASPQVAAVASLIYEKDLDVSADFVRGLIDESANLYGDEISYGNGLVDAEYALEHYDEYKKAYEKYEENKKADKDFEEPELEENEKEITTFDDTGCVEGSWTKAIHEELAYEGNVEIRKGARFPDIIWEDEQSDGKGSTYRFYGMVLNPWWHGAFEYYIPLNDKIKYKNNYIKAAIYTMRMANSIYSNRGDASKANNSSYCYSEEMLEDIKRMDEKIVADAQNKKITKWEKELKTEYLNYTKRRDFVRGMALHIITDVYAHSIYYNGEIISHERKKDKEKSDADNPSVCPERYEDAEWCASSIVQAYKNGLNINYTNFVNITYCSPNVVYVPSTYKIAEIFTNLNDYFDNIPWQIKTFSYGDRYNVK